MTKFLEISGTFICVVLVYAVLRLLGKAWPNGEDVRENDFKGHYLKNGGCSRCGAMWMHPGWSREGKCKGKQS